MVTEKMRSNIIHFIYKEYDTINGLMKAENYWFIYIVRCSDQTLYTGVTNDLETRIKTHNSGKGAKYTRPRLPVKLVYSEKAIDQSTACKREWEIKQLSRTKKQKLINNANLKGNQV